MSRRRGKADMDDLDDVLGDLLADDDPPKKPAPARGAGARGRAGGPAAAKKGPGVFDDDFYASLAADTKDEESDVSDADMDAMKGVLDDLDDMDAMLFGGKKSAPAKTPPKKTPAAAAPDKGTTPTKTPPASSPPKPANKSSGLFDDDDDIFGSKPRAKPANKPSADLFGDDLFAGKPKAPSSGDAKPLAKKKSFSFDDDDDDPLADLLSDDEMSKKKKSPAATKKEEDDDTASISSRRLEIERPPTRSGNNRDSGPPDDDTPAPPKKTPAQRRKEEVSFDDDDDLLGGLGIDDSPKPQKKAVGKSEDREGKSAKSILDDLMGKGTKIDDDPPKKREFVLDKRYTKSADSERGKKEPEEEDFSFGGYMPSSAGGSRPSSRRSVRFENDDADIFGDRPSRSAGGGRRGKSMFEDMIGKDDTDWLDMASGSPSKPKPKPKESENDRPRSAGDLLDKPASILKPSTADSAASEPVDWLGLSRLGSPESPKQPQKKISAEPQSEQKPSKPLPSRARTPERKNSSDFLGLGDSGPKPVTKAAADSKDDDDWLGLGARRRAGQSVKKTEEPKPKATTGGSVTDWLGGKEVKADKDDSGGDFLGLGQEVDPDELGSGKWSQQPAPFDKPTSRADERGLDLFTPPPTRETISSFPWDMDKRKKKQTEAASGSPAKKAPERTSSPPKSPRGSLAGSPRGLAATLQHLEQMEEKVDVPPPKQPQRQPSLETTPSIGPSVPATSVGAVAMTTPALGSTLAEQQLQQQQAAMFAQQQQQMRQQEEMLRQQQQQLAQQQQQQQMALQQKMQAEQERVMRERRQQLEALQQAQQQMMQSQSAASFSMATAQPMMMSSPQSTFGIGGFGMPGMEADLQSRIKTLEMEKIHLQSMLDTVQKQHQEQVKMLEESYEGRIKLLEETFEKRETRLKDENNMISTQSMEHLKQKEQEKAELIASQANKYDEWEKRKQEEIGRLKEQQRVALDGLRQDQEEALQRLRKVKDQEIESVANSQDTTKSLQSVMQQISVNTRDLGDLQYKVDNKHFASMEERETAARNRDEQLKMLQDRLARQQHDNELERARLQGLIAKMEVQMTEQTRELEEEKWRVRQEESKLQAQQKSLDQERQHLLEKLERERAEIKKSKDHVIEEQKAVMAQLYEERRVLAEERAQFNISQKLRLDQEQRESAKTMKQGAEVEGSIRIITEEKAKLAAQAGEMQREEERLAKERAEFETAKHKLEIEREKLVQLALQNKQKSKEIEDYCQAAAVAQDEGAKNLEAARKIEYEQNTRLQNTQAQLQALRSKEKQIAQERLALAKERQALEVSQGSLLCINCRSPLRNSVPIQHGPHATPPSHLSTNVLSRQVSMTPAAKDLMAALSNYDIKENNLARVSSALQVDSSVRLWKIAAEKDKAFLDEESMFLEALKHSPYHNPQYTM